MDNQHSYVCGKSGMGKSTFLLNEVFREIARRDRALVFIDPHGETALALLDALPRSLIKQTVYIDASDRTHAVGFNPIRNPLHCLSGLKSIWIDSWGPRMEWLLLNALLLLGDNPGMTFQQLPPLFYDARHRDKLLRNTRNAAVLKFWREEFPRKYESSKDNPDSPILNKIGQLNTSSISRILCQHSPKFDFRDALSERRIVVCNLHIPTIGDEAAAILGSLLTTTLRDALLTAPAPCTLFADEFQKYGTTIYAAMLSEMRKFGLRMVLAHQYVSQIDERLQKAILGNVRQKVIFNVDYEDAEVLARSYNRLTQEFNPAAITELEPYEAYVNGVLTRMPAFVPPFGTGKAKDVMERSRRGFARSLAAPSARQSAA